MKLPHAFLFVLFCGGAHLLGQLVWCLHSKTQEQWKSQWCKIWRLWILGVKESDGHAIRWTALFHLQNDPPSKYQIAKRDQRNGLPYRKTRSIRSVVPHCSKEGPSQEQKQSNGKEDKNNFCVNGWQCCAVHLWVDFWGGGEWFKSIFRGVRKNPGLDK